MENEKVKKSNLCAQIGVLLTLLNLVVSSAFLITESTGYLLIFTSLTAVSSLVLSICGLSNSKKSGRGKILSVTGIVVNVLILAVMLALAIYLVIGFRSSSEI